MSRPLATIGPYRLLEALGQGGAGQVFRALDPHGELVALKLLRGGASAAQRQRFYREARALSKVAHPGVVRLRDAGEERGQAYLVLDYQPHGSLQDRLDRQGPLPPSEAARIGAEVAAALASAHAHGVLHRDLKPDNVLLTAAGRPLLTDFGLAKDLERIGQTAALTQSGALTGTPGFWAPEQAAGRVDAIGPWTDVYGLGALLYAALSGAPPITGSSLFEVAALTAEGAIVPLGARAPHLPPALVELVMACLASDPTRRPASATDVADELASVLATPPPSWRAPRWLAVGLLGALGAAGGAALLASAGNAARTSPAPSRPPSPALVQVSAAPSPRPLSELDDAALGAAARGGDPTAQVALADRLRQRGPREEAEARRLYQLAAEQGHGLGLRRAAEMAQLGLGGPPDLARAERYLRLGAERDERWAWANLGVLLTSPERRDLREAELWLRRAAEAGDATAMYNLSSLLALVPDRPGAAEEGELWLRRGADAGSISAARRLVQLLASRAKGPEQFGELTPYYRRLAEADDGHGCYGYARALSQGLGVPVDVAASVTWVRRSAELEYWDGMLMWAAYLINATGVPRDLVAARRWVTRVTYDPASPPDMQTRGQDLLRLLAEIELAPLGARLAPDGARLLPPPTTPRAELEAAAQAGQLAPMVELADQLLNQGQTEQARAWYERAAEGGSREGAFGAGICLARGVGGQADPERGRSLLQVSARAGHSAALTELGHLALLRAGGIEDAAQAWRAAAQAGYLEGMDCWADCLMTGQGVPRDPGQGRAWRLKAASGGIAPAQYRLGLELQAEAEADPERWREALNWLRRSAEQGHRPAMQALGAALLQDARSSPELQREGARWARDAARLGDTAAMVRYGVALGDGVGVDPDPSGAAAWLRQALRHGRDAAELERAGQELRRFTTGAR